MGLAGFAEHAEAQSTGHFMRKTPPHGGLRQSLAMPDDQKTHRLSPTSE
jgi:hypothetical protein